MIAGLSSNRVFDGALADIGGYVLFWIALVLFLAWCAVNIWNLFRAPARIRWQRLADGLSTLEGADRKTAPATPTVAEKGMQAIIRMLDTDLASLDEISKSDDSYDRRDDLIEWWDTSYTGLVNEWDVARSRLSPPPWNTFERERIRQMPLDDFTKLVKKRRDSLTSLRKIAAPTPGTVHVPGAN